MLQAEGADDAVNFHPGTVGQFKDLLLNESNVGLFGKTALIALLLTVCFQVCFFFVLLFGVLHLQILTTFILLSTTLLLNATSEWVHNAQRTIRLTFGQTERLKDTGAVLFQSLLFLLYFLQCKGRDDRGCGTRSSTRCRGLAIRERTNRCLHHLAGCFGDGLVYNLTIDGVLTCFFRFLDFGFVSVDSTFGKFGSNLSRFLNFFLLLFYLQFNLNFGDFGLQVGDAFRHDLINGTFGTTKFVQIIRDGGEVAHFSTGFV